MSNFWLSIVIFLLAYVFIIIEKVHRSVVVWVAAALVISLGVISQAKAIEAIDFNTLWLLIGMMVIVGITRKSGVFEYIAIKSAKLARGNPLYIMLILALVTALASALLDNVTTVLLMVPVTFAITYRLEISPLPFFHGYLVTAGASQLAHIFLGHAAGSYHQ